MKKLFIQFNNICYLRMSFDLKMRDIFETNNQREYLKWCTKVYKKLISRLEIIELIQEVFAIQTTGQNWLPIV